MAWISLSVGKYLNKDYYVLKLIYMEHKQHVHDVCVCVCVYGSCGRRYLIFMHTHTHTKYRTCRLKSSIERMEFSVRTRARNTPRTSIRIYANLFLAEIVECVWEILYYIVCIALFVVTYEIIAPETRTNLGVVLIASNIFPKTS